MSITKRSDQKSRSYWATVEEARKEVSKWPTWKREFRLMEIFKSDNSCHSADDLKKKP